MRETTCNQGTRVASVVVTYNRSDVLDSTLRAVHAQTRAPDLVVVADNDSPDGTERMVRTGWPSVTYLRLPENLGFAAGLAAGMRLAQEHGFDYCWLLDDDSTPAPLALQRNLEVASAVGRFGIVGLSGGMLRFGTPDRRPERRRALRVGDENRLYGVDFVLVDGALVSLAAAAIVGYPRGDFFMMMEDVEYTSRLKGAGFEVVLLDEDLIDRGHLGSTGDAGSGAAPPWRGYYQSRNQLRVALEQRSPSKVYGWAVRQGKYCLAALTRDRGWTRVRLRLLGGWHALRGRDGRTIEPAAFR